MVVLRSLCPIPIYIFLVCASFCARDGSLTRPSRVNVRLSGGCEHLCKVGRKVKLCVGDSSRGSFACARIFFGGELSGVSS